jgi:Mor family transcriptional regulator
MVDDLSIPREVRILDPKLREHVDTFRVLLLQTCSQTIFPELLEVFGAEAVIKFMDIFGGTVIKVPSRSFLEQVTRDVDIYNMVKNSIERETAVDYLSYKYDTSNEHIMDCYNRVCEIRNKYGLK